MGSCAGGTHLRMTLRHARPKSFAKSPVRGGLAFWQRLPKSLLQGLNLIRCGRWQRFQGNRFAVLINQPGALERFDLLDGCHGLGRRRKSAIAAATNHPLSERVSSAALSAVRDHVRQCGSLSGGTFRQIAQLTDGSPSVTSQTAQWRRGAAIQSAGFATGLGARGPPPHTVPCKPYCRKPARAVGQGTIGDLRWS
jgi:hypothetical protein